MEIRNYKESVNYLESFIGKIIFNVKSSEDPLKRMRIFLNFLDNPQDKFKSVLVGGTSGKSSTSYLISHILTTAGYKTGFTLSPHLQKINERIQINGKSISDKEFARLLNSILYSIEGMKRMRIGVPSYFEILIGMVFKYFADQKVDIAVVEVGMGGEFDATNTLNPLVAVLTNVGLDHTNILGKTVEEIARTKAGIIKKNYESRIKNHGINNYSSIIHDSSFMIQPIVIAGIKQASVIKIVENRCREVGAKLLRLGKDFNLTNYKVSLLGDYQRENASLAVEAVLQLKKFGFEVSEKDIVKALSTAFFPGRFEIIKLDTKILGYKDIKKKSKEKSLNISVSQYPNISLVLDGAHNPTKMHAFLNSLQKIFPKQRKVFIIGFKFDKDIPKMLRQITKVADEIIVTEFRAKTDVALHASADAEDIAEDIKILGYKDIKIEKDSEKALRKAFNILISQYPNVPAVIVVTGSLYLVGEIRNKL